MLEDGDAGGGDAGGGGVFALLFFSGDVAGGTDPPSGGFSGVVCSSFFFFRTLIKYRMPKKPPAIAAVSPKKISMDFPFFAAIFTEAWVNIDPLLS